MKAPLFVRALTAPEEQALHTGLHSADAFTLRRCPILLASQRGERPSRIAQQVGCGEQTVRNALHAFAAQGLAALRRGSSRPHTLHRALDADADLRLRALVQRSPREFGYPRSLWTLALLAAVCEREGITAHRVSYETIRQALRRLDLRWQRAKHWLTSTDARYARKKAGATGC